MLSGIVSRDALSNLLRTLSLKQRQGVLEITLPNSYFELCLIDGIIVQVRCADDALSRSIIERLLCAKLITKELTAALSDVEMTAEQLYEFLVGQRHVVSKDFMKAKAACEHDLIMSLRTAHEGFFNFTPKVVQYRAELSFQGYPCQLLLDMIEYDADESRLIALMNQVDDETDIIFRQIGERSLHFTDTETVVWDTIGAKNTLRHVYEQSLLSSHALQHALLSLSERNLIEMVSASIGKPTLGATHRVVRDGNVKNNIVQSRVVTNDSSIDDFDMTLAPEMIEEQEVAQISNSVKVGAGKQVDVIDKAVSLLRGMDSAVKEQDSGYELKEDEEEVSPFTDATVNRMGDSFGDLSLFDESSVKTELVAQDTEDSIDKPKTKDANVKAFAANKISVQSGSVVKESSRVSLPTVSNDTSVSGASISNIKAAPVEKFINPDIPPSKKYGKQGRYVPPSRFWVTACRLNTHFQKMHVAANVSIVVVLVFTVVVALVAPHMIDKWFDALLRFSSKS